MVENRVLREQLGPKRIGFTDKQRGVLAEKGQAVGRKQLKQIASIASPDTILRWFRELVAKKYDGSKWRRPGPVGNPSEIKDLVVQMARENRTWVYTRLVGAMANLGYKVGRNTVKHILQEAGVPPAPERRQGMPWKLFLSVHWDAIAAADFFSVEVMTLKGLTRYMVLVVMELKTRRVEVAGIAHDPYGAWMMQMGRNLLDREEGFLIDKRDLLVDRDPLLTADFQRLLGDSDVELVRLPPRGPNLNCYIERFVRSIREECLDQMVVLGERHLRTVIRQYMEHFHEERNHQGLNNRLTAPCQPVPECEGAVVRRERLGGLLSYYHRKEAA